MRSEGIQSSIILLCISPQAQLSQTMRKCPWALPGVILSLCSYSSVFIYPPLGEAISEPNLLKFHCDVLALLRNCGGKEVSGAKAFPFILSWHACRDAEGEKPRRARKVPALQRASLSPTTPLVSTSISRSLFMAS